MKHKLPQIAVVIPAFNEEKYLPKCLKALQNQNYPKNLYNILVVNNNSTDHTAEIAKKFGARVLKEEKQGHVYSLNTGLLHAKGDIIAVTDADTVVTKDWLFKLSQIFEDKTVVGVTGSIKLDIESKLFNAFITKLYNLFLTINFSCNKPHTAGPNMAIRKSVFINKLKCVDTRYKISGDVEIGMRLRKHGKVKFAKSLTVTTSSRRFKSDFWGFTRDFLKYSVAYVCAIWLQRPPTGHLLPIR